MANTIVNVKKFSNGIQANLRTMNPAIAVASTRYEAALRKGQTFDNPYGTPARLQDYSYSTDLEIDAEELTSDVLTIDQVKAATKNYDPLQDKLTVEWLNEAEEDMGYQLSRNINQYVAQTGVDDATKTVAGGAVTESNVIDYLTDISVQMSRNRGKAGAKFGLVEPAMVGYLGLANVANGFNEADSTLRQGYKGTTSLGFRIYECHDLPCTVTLTMDTQPTAGDTFELLGVEWAWIADGATAASGELKIGANVADAKAIFVAAVNGATAPSAGDYADISTYDRREYQNAQLTAATFSGDDCVLTAYGRIGAAETFTASTNVFGDETCSQVFGYMGAIDLVVQSAPRIEERMPEKNVSVNIIGTTQFGAHTYFQNKKRVVAATMTV